MRPIEFFRSPQHITHKHYEALRAFYLEAKSAREVAQQFGYTLSSFYSLTRDFNRLLNQPAPSERFFVTLTRGRKPKDSAGDIDTLITELRKKYLSVPDIKAILDSLGHEVSESYVYDILKEQGFGRLPRRSQSARDETIASVKLQAAPSEPLGYTPETFSTHNSVGLLCLLPYIQHYGIHRLIETSHYPETQTINRLSSLLSFVALKLSNVRRYTADDLWCMDRGLGFFAGLNVLPKAAWFSSYSHRITRKMNQDFLKGLHTLWQTAGFLSDTANLDFVTIPYWGDDTHLENNWSGTRNKALGSVLAVLAQDPDTGIITYGDTSVRHKNKERVVLEFLDFYTQDASDELKYLVFDSQFTTYQQLRKLEDRPNPIKFLTIRRRGKKIVEELNALPRSDWKKLRVMAADGKGRLLRINEQTPFLKEYGKPIRQVAITGHGKIKPALIITNDFDLPLATIIRKYARRWLVEQQINEQTQFFHLNRVSSSMVIKVDFDLTMSILAHNLYRLLAEDLPGFTHNTAATLFDKFMMNSGQVHIADDSVTVIMKKKRNIPALLTALEKFQNKSIVWMQNRKFRVVVDSTS